MNSKIVEWHIANGRDHLWRTRKYILGMNDLSLDRTHDYIQWLFPLDEPSRFNKRAPLLSIEDIEILSSYTKIVCENVSYFLMFLYRGLERQKPQYWIQPNNHNHLRITRLLKHLMILKMRQHAAYVFNFVVKHNENEALDNAIPYWRDALCAN